MSIQPLIMNMIAASLAMQQGFLPDVPSIDALKAYGQAASRQRLGGGGPASR